MSNIKLEKVVNENKEDNLFMSDYASIEKYEMINSQNENLRILLSCNKLQWEEQKCKINELNSKISDLNNSIKTLQQELLLTKEINETSSNVIQEKNIYLNVLYDSVQKIELINFDKKPINDPKSAVLKINQFQYDTKHLKTRVTDNKILIMTLCKILNCDETKLIQSMKSIINEKNVIQTKCKLLEQFYQRSLALTANMTDELHSGGHEKTPASLNNVMCKMHSQSCNDWNKRMFNSRYQNLQKDKTNSHYPTFTPWRTHPNWPVIQANTENFQSKSYPFDKPVKLNHFGLLEKNEPPSSQFDVTTRNNSLQSGYYIPSTSQLIPSNYNSLVSNIKPLTLTNSTTHLPTVKSSSEFQNPRKRKTNDLDNFQQTKKSFQTNPNVYDWQNLSKEGKLELLKLETKEYPLENSKDSEKIQT